MMRSINITFLALWPFSILVGGQLQNTDKPVDQQARITELRNTIRNEELFKSQPETVIAAIKELGRLKASSAIDDLVKLITLRQKFEWEKEIDGKIAYSSPPHLIGVTEYYPAAGALFEIGKPSVPALLRLIANTPKESIESKNAHTTIMIIYRDDPAEGVSVFRKALAKAKAYLP